MERNEDLESCLLTAQSSREALQQQADQLRHDVSLKEQLLRLYIRHANEADLTDSTPNLTHPFFEDELVIYIVYYRILTSWSLHVYLANYCDYVVYHVIV